MEFILEKAPKLLVLEDFVMEMVTVKVMELVAELQSFDGLEFLEEIDLNVID